MTTPSGSAARLTAPWLPAPAYFAVSAVFHYLGPAVPQEQRSTAQHIVKVFFAARVVDLTALASDHDHAEIQRQGHHAQAGARDMAFGPLQQLLLVHDQNSVICIQVPHLDAAILGAPAVWNKEKPP